MGSWLVSLDGVLLSGGDEPAIGTLSGPPAGLDLPPLRTEDVTFPQQDGVQHFADWYEPRIITLEDVTVCGDDCAGCTSARTKVRMVTDAWRRRCDDTELVVWTNCATPPSELLGFGEGPFGEGPFGGAQPDDEYGLVGPFGIIGRPRVAQTTWLGSGECASMLLRFDAVDHRMYILDPDGTPGSGGQCLTLNPDSTTFCRSYPRCYDMCYDTESDTGGAGPLDAVVRGNLCAPLTITLTPGLTNPVIENVTTGETLGYNGTLLPGVSPVIINTQDGTASQDGQSRTNLLTGSAEMSLAVGTSTLRLITFSTSDTGTAEVCWRPAVDSA